MSEMSYLEKLLDGVEVEWVTLGSMADIGTGSSNRQDESENGIYPFYVRSKNILKSDTFEFDEVAIVIPGEGGIGDIFHYVEGKYALHQRAYRIRITTNAVDTKFLYYFMSSSFKQYILTKSVGATAISIRKPMLEGFKVPIPSPDNPEKSLAIQSEIVRILDKFTALTAELTAELNMRKKQYNYYRDQLLSFNTEDVPHLPMGQKDIGEFIRGGTFQKKDFIDAGVGCIHYGQIYTYYGTYTEKTKTYISTALAKKCKKAQKGDLIIATTSENDEDVCKAVAWLGSEDIAVSSDACIYKHNLNPKYVSYFFQTEQFQNQKRQYITGAKVRRVNADNLSKILIPVPSMEIQERIVSILDKFDTLTNSITEGLPREIELRQKQYEYYRDLLFSFPKPETASN
ncbi:restriction endonuclease subunit S [Escherichia coli]|uniref:restriction endonuclease subunit S n=1 Tax=Escherichia coli TaxID=562 RepID=UPI00227F4885|nr:restriction endonuclease subunit S [Escherichia coli]MCZ0220719.1 restriction endonuclease subunit S [Escherichia coli]MCZ0259731.1 restriction endonuclease subunit S [Escherichia coli]